MYFSRVRVRPEIFKSTQLAKVLSDSSYNIHRMLWDLFPGEKERNFLYREEIAREQIGGTAGVRGEPVYYLVSPVMPFTENPVFDVQSREYQPKLKEGDRLNFELRANPVTTRKVERQDRERYLQERKKRQVADKGKLTKKRVRHDVVMDAQKTFLLSLCEELNLQSGLSAFPKKKDIKSVLLTHGGSLLDERLTRLLENDYSYAERLRYSMQGHEKLEWGIKAVVDNALMNWIEKQGEQHGFILVADDREDQCKLQNSAYRWHALTKKAEKGEKSGFSSVDFTGELQVTDIEKFENALFSGIGPAKAFGCGLMLVKRI